jgi:chaperonin GroES
MELQAVGNKVIISPLAAEEKETEGGLILPDSVKQDGHNGTVIAVGPDVDKRITVGTKVTFPPQAGAAIKTGKRKMIVMRDIDILYFYEDKAVSA